MMRNINWEFILLMTANVFVWGLVIWLFLKLT